MPSTRLDITLRPLKFGFVVDPSDAKAIMEAIQVNTLLWGGVYNPIIPRFNKIPKNWEHPRTKSQTATSIFNGYIGNFDPDFLVPIRIKEFNKAFADSRRIVTLSEIIGNTKDSGIPGMGIGIFEILRSLINKELKYIRKNPLNFNIPIISGKCDLFFASVFGALSPDLADFFHQNYDKTLGTEWTECNFANYSDFFQSNNFFLRRLTNHRLKVNRHHPWYRGSCIFYLDATKSHDIIDYWNLRAIGWNVMPVPIQAGISASLKKSLLEFIQEYHVRDRYNPKIYHNLTLIKSRSLKSEDVEKFEGELNLPKSTTSHERLLSYQSFYPRMWDEWALKHDDVECCDLEAGKLKTDLSDSRQELSFRTLDPEFMLNNPRTFEARYANEIEVRNYGDKELIAEVIPECDHSMVSAIGGFDVREWRFAKKAIIYFSRHQDWSVQFYQPSAEKVISTWLKTKNWDTVLSPSGRIAKQMILQLGGIFGINWLSNEYLVQFITKMSSGRTMLQETFFAEFAKIAEHEKYKTDPKNMLARLMKTGMFRLGFEIQCPTCTQFSWYSFTDADYEMQCEKCLSKLQLPSHSPNDIKLSYRTLGPFNLPNQAFGVYPVLLTLRFFAHLLDGATTPLLSSEFRCGDVIFEVDLTCLFRKSRFSDYKTELIFCECKSYNQFKKKDIDRMALLAHNFPGAFIVLSTFRKTLSKSEIKLMRSLAIKGRRYWKSDRPYNPVLILTGTELFSGWGPPECWKDAGGAQAIFAQKYHGWKDLLSLCDATQQIYLDMKPWHEWLEEKWKKRTSSKRTEQTESIT